MHNNNPKGIVINEKMVEIIQSFLWQKCLERQHMFSLMNLYLLKKQDCIILILYENIVNKNK